jgi:thiopurine S-methyltransferase
MQPEFWRDRWRIGQIGFHQSAVDRNLSEHWPDLLVPKDRRVFVPLCGKSLDLLWLCGQGHTVIGIELADIALQAFCLENGVAARRRILPDFDRYEAPYLELLRGDFFALTPELLGTVSAVYDRAALISWAPQLRARYIERMVAITEAGTETLLITLEYPQTQFTGPPFSVDGDEVKRLYSGHHAIRELTRRDILASEPRLRARGVSSLTEVCYRITRLQYHRDEHSIQSKA